MNRGDIYLIKFKEPDKIRPALILTRTEAISNLNSVTVVPITGAIREVRSQVFLDENDGMDRPCVINLDNIQTVVQHKVGSFVTHLSDDRMAEVFEALKFAFGFDK